MLALTGIALLADVPVIDSRQTDLVGYKTHFRIPTYSSRRQWEERREHLRQQILGAAGLLPMPRKAPLHPRVVKRMVYNDYSIETVLLETLPGYFLGGNLYRPAGNKKQPAPAVLIPHGHWKRGRLEDQPTYSVPALGINLARQGYIAFSYDMVGFQDTRQTSHSFGGWAETLWSFTPLGLQLWNSTRALDYLESLPDVDARRIAATGASGGGTQTFLLAAVDERVRYAAPVNMVSASMQGGDPCEEAPNLRLDHTSNVEITAMIAPRPLLLVSSTHDWTKHTPEEEFPAIRYIYALYGAVQQVRNVHIDAEHNYNRQSREAVYQFFAQHMQPDLDSAQMTERSFSLPKDQDLLAYGDQDLPPGTPNFDEVFQSWKVSTLLPMQTNLSSAVLQDALRASLGTMWPTSVESRIQGNRVILSREEQRDRVEGLWIPGKGDAVLLIHPAGAAAAVRTILGAEIVRSKRPVLAIDVFHSAMARRAHERSENYFLSYHRTDDAQRVQDILTALSFLKRQGRGTPEVIGMGDAGIWALFAAAAAPVETHVMADLNGFGGTDEDYRDRFFVPGIQRVGGLSTALKLLRNVRTIMPAPSGIKRTATDAAASEEKPVASGQ